MTERRCNCRFGKQEGLKGHQDGCPMLLPPPKVERDPMRHAHPVAVVTGGSEEQVLHGRPSTIDYNIEELNRITQREIGTAVEDSAREFIGSVDGIPLPDETATKLGRLMLAHVHVVQPPAEPAAATITSLVAIDVIARGRGVGPESVPAGEADPIRMAYGALIDACCDLRRYLRKRDGK